MIVVGCGKAKRAQPAQAKDLYVGSLFRAAKSYAVATGKQWVILSAAHGVVAPELWLRPYDNKLDLRGDALKRWARLASEEIARRRLQSTEPVEILAGRTYAAPLAKALERLGIDSVQPLEGLTLGFRLRELYRKWEHENDRRRGSDTLEAVAR